MTGRYLLTGPTRHPDFNTYQLYEWTDGVFKSYAMDPCATIQVSRASGITYVCTPRVTRGLQANSFDHAVEFLKGILSITELERRAK